MKEIGDRIKSIIKTKGLSITNISDELHISQGNLSLILAGKRKMDIHFILQIAIILQIDIRNIVYEKEIDYSSLKVNEGQEIYKTKIKTKEDVENENEKLRFENDLLKKRIFEQEELVALFKSGKLKLSE